MQLNPPQQEAVEHDAGACLVIAGAGSGKTRVLTSRIERLVVQGVAPWRILGFTFTNKAAGEMRERLEASLGRVAQRLWLGTFHATGVRILRRDSDAAGIDRDFNIYDADDQQSLLKRVIGDLALPDGSFTPQSARGAIERLKRSLVRPEQLTREAEGFKEAQLARVYKAYEDGLRRAGALDFTDLIARPVRMFEEDEEAAARWSERFDYVLVDEFQDTNRLQMRFIEHLASSSGNLFVVGDDDQSIYGWRGAEVANILNFEKQWEACKVIRLEQNYRSTRPILEVANAVIANNSARKGKNLWTAQDEGEKVQVHTVLDDDEEAESMARRIRAAGSTDQDWTRFAVLYRTHAQSRALEGALGKYRIPYRIIGGTRFYDRKEIRDLLAYLKAAANPADTVSLMRILNTPPRGIGKTSEARLLDLARRKELEPGLMLTAFPEFIEELPAAAAARLKDFGKLLVSLSGDPAKDAAPTVLERLLQKVPYLEYLEGSDPEQAATRKENVEELVNAAQAFFETRLGQTVGEEELEERVGTPGSLVDFLADVALVADVDSLDAGANTVTLMTLHNAKGLEYDSIHLTGVEEALLPHAMSVGEESELEEERRLFYVGVTRARKRLVISHALNRRKFGDTLPASPSRFLDELPEEWVQREGEELAHRADAFAPRRQSYDSRSSWQQRRSGGVTRAPSSGGDWSDFSQDTPEYEDMSQEEDGLRVGQRVMHPSLGPGTVHKLEGGGEKLRVIVMFDKKGPRKLMARVAGLKPM